MDEQKLIEAIQENGGTVTISRSTDGFTSTTYRIGRKRGFSPESVPARCGPDSICELNLSVRTTNLLESAGIETIGQLAAKTPDDLLTIRSFGVTSLEEVRCQLWDKHGLKLKDDFAREPTNAS